MFPAENGKSHSENVSHLSGNGPSTGVNYPKSCTTLGLHFKHVPFIFSTQRVQPPSSVSLALLKVSLNIH